MLVQNHYVFGGLRTLRPETQLFVNNSRQTIPSVISALDVCFGAFIDANLWDKINCFYPNVGVNQYNHQYNAKAPYDADYYFRKVYSGTITSTVDGDEGDGLTGFVDTKFAPVDNQTLTSNGITICVGTNNTVVGSEAVECGVFRAVNEASLLITKTTEATPTKNARMNGDSIIYNNGNNAKGIFSSNRNGSVAKIFENGIVEATGVGNGTLPDLYICIHALNLNGNIYGYSNQRIQSVIFQSDMSDADIVTMHTILDDFENALGRKTW